MKVVILAGGLGTRLSEVTEVKPKPMVEIGGKPILYHIMKIYSHYGFNEFVILLGYKGYTIKEYFANFFLHHSNLTIDLQTSQIETHTHSSENWKVTLVETGLHTMTAGRLKQAKPYINNDTFFCTYGDGVGNVDIGALLDFHKKKEGLMTITTVQPEGRYGAVDIGEDENIIRFNEKPKNADTWINAGFFVCEPQMLDYIDGDGHDTMLERGPMEKLALHKHMYAYRHTGFWHPMDTLRDNTHLNNLWNKGNAPWKI